MSYKRESRERNELRIKNIEETLKHPETLVPDCLDRVLFCPFVAYEKKLKENVDLLKFSKSHDEFLRGLAETKRAIDDDEISFSGLLKTPHGTATYFKKGDTDQYVLAGIQNEKHDVFRMLSFSRIVLSGKSVIYSCGSYYRSTCRNTPPESIFIENVLKEENISFTSHTQTGLPLIGSGDDFIELYIFGEPKLLVGPQSKINTPTKILKYVLCKDPLQIFSFNIDKLSRFSDKGESALFASYIGGGITDLDFFQQVVSRRKSLAKDSGLFLIGAEPFPDINSFLGKIDLSESEKKAISNLWPSGEGIYIDDASPRKLYETLWPEIGEQIVDHLYPGALEKHRDIMKGNPMEILERLDRTLKLEETKEKMQLRSWSVPSGQLADLIVLGITEGSDSLSDYISKMSMKESDSQAVAFCIQELFKLNKSQSWKISSDAAIKGRMISPYVEKIIQNPGQDPDKLFQEISKIIR
ncbi:MAG: hypothetical protein ACYCSO_07875 [Cuniculiplasma sp.]